MEPTYHKIQFGWAPPVAGFLLAVLTVKLFYIVPQSRFDSNAALLFYVPLGLIVLYVVNFSAMSVTADEKELVVAFGPGLLSFRFAVDGIKSVRTARIPWRYGWGILRRGNTRIYSVGFGSAVELETESGKVLSGLSDARGLV
ncbi:MAG: hypothetical protein RMM53_01210, partial [Bacteroidia bacterium]|nr:hypothetical protein [Bacteroidia bacterium]